MPRKESLKPCINLVKFIMNKKILIMLKIVGKRQLDKDIKRQKQGFVNYIRMS